MYAIVRSSLTSSELAIQILQGVPTLEQMQAVVDGYIEAADRIQTNRRNITAEIYCNEEGNYMNLPVTYRNKWGQPIRGNLVIVGGNDRTGESVELTFEEITSILLESMGVNLLNTTLEVVN